MKGIKKRISLLLVLVMSFLFSTQSFAAYGGDEAVQGDAYNLTCDEITQKISAEFYQSLRNMDIEINEDTEIQVCMVDSAEVLVLTNRNDSTVTKEIVLGLDETGEIQPIIIGDENAVAPCAGGSAQYPYPDTNPPIVIRATAVYNEYVGRLGYVGYQPIGVYFRYTKNNPSASVSRISVDYDCIGFEMTYPGFEFLTDANYQNIYTHTINVTKNNPNPNTMYDDDATGAYRTDRVIYTQGGWDVGQKLTFYYTLNGSAYTKTLPVTPN